MVDSLDDLKSSRSVWGKDFPNFEMLDAQIASALNKIIQNSQFKKKVSLEEQKAQKRRPVSARKTDRLHESTTNFEWLVLMIPYCKRLIYALLLFMMTEFRNSIRDGTKFFCQCQKNPSDEILESLYKLRIRESCATQKRILIVRHGDSIRRYRFPTIKSWKSWWRGVLTRNFDDETLTLGTGELNPEQWCGVERDLSALKVFVSIWKKKGQCSQGDRCSFRHETQDPAQKTKTHCRHAFWANRITRSKCVEEEKYPRQK